MTKKMKAYKINIENDDFDFGLAALHLFFAVIFGAFFLNAGQLFKFLLLPYVVLTFLYPKKEMLPGLAILMCYGTILTILGAVVIIGISFTKITEIKEKKIFRLWLLLIGAFPLYLFNILTRIFELDYSFVDSLLLNDYYFAFWFLIFGALNPGLISRKSTSFLLFVTILIVFVDRVDDNEILSFRILYRLIPVAETILCLFLFLIFRKMIPLTNDLYIRLSLVIFFLTRLLLGIPDYKFTFLFGLIISFSFVIQKRFFNQDYDDLTLAKVLKLRSSLLTFIPIPFLVITLMATPFFVSDYAFVDASNYYESKDNLFDVIMNKLFVDRGLLWTGAIAGVIENSSYLPPLEEWFISFNTVFDYTMDVDFEAHNLLIELIRKNGYIMGLLLSFTYLRWQYKLIKSTKGGDRYLNVFRYAIFGVAISVFTTGQYTLQLNTSFYFMTLTGALVISQSEANSQGEPPKKIVDGG